MFSVQKVDLGLRFLPKVVLGNFLCLCASQSLYISFLYVLKTNERNEQMKKLSIIHLSYYLGIIQLFELFSCSLGGGYLSCCLVSR